MCWWLLHCRIRAVCGRAPALKGGSLPPTSCQAWGVTYHARCCLPGCQTLTLRYLLHAQLPAALQLSGTQLPPLLGLVPSAVLVFQAPVSHFLLSVAHWAASSHQQVHQHICLLPNACLQTISTACLQSADEQLCTSSMPAPPCPALPAASLGQVLLNLHCLQLVSWWLGTASLGVMLHAAAACKGHAHQEVLKPCTSLPADCETATQICTTPCTDAAEQCSAQHAACQLAAEGCPGLHAASPVVQMVK